jgi:hypothetical protein
VIRSPTRTTALPMTAQKKRKGNMLTINKNQAITKLNRLIEDGRQNAGQVIEHVMTHQPQDYIVRANALEFNGNGGLHVTLNDSEFGVHRFALGQIAENAGLPVKFLDSLTASEWGRALVAHNLSEIFKHRDAKRHLVRTLNNEVRGFLSDSYRRLDSRPIIEAFVTGVMKLGALPFKGYVSDTKVCIQAIVPDVFEAIPGARVAFCFPARAAQFLLLMRKFCKRRHELRSGEVDGNLRRLSSLESGQAATSCRASSYDVMCGLAAPLRQVLSGQVSPLRRADSWACDVKSRAAESGRFEEFCHVS